MTDVDAAAVALVVLVLASGCIAPSAAAPESSTKTVATTTTATTPSTTTTAPTTTTTRTLWNGTNDTVTREVDAHTDAGTDISIQKGTLRNASFWEGNDIVEVPAKYIWVWLSEPHNSNVTYAVATNCTEYRKTYSPVHIQSEIGTNRTHNFEQWDFISISRVDTGEEVVRLDLNGADRECSPPLPKTAGDSSA
jgi:hypothetical protein